jgi:hypothetical protein
MTRGLLGKGLYLDSSGDGRKKVFSCGITRRWREEVSTWDDQRYTGKRSLPGMTREWQEEVYTWDDQRINRKRSVPGMTGGLLGKGLYLE